MPYAATPPRSWLFEHYSGKFITRCMVTDEIFFTSRQTQATFDFHSRSGPDSQHQYIIPVSPWGVVVPR